MKCKIFPKVSLAILFLSSMSAYSQVSKLQTRDLKIGDTIPNLEIKHIIGSKKIYHTSDLYKSGLLIINFWATWCVPCIRELPKLDSLKRQFPGLNVVSVAYEDSLKIKNFLKGHKDINASSLIIPTNDQVFINYFKHRTLPHNVWVDKDGVVRSITNAEEISTNNVGEFLKKGQLKLNVKQDKLNFDNTKPFHLGDSTFQYRSIFTKYVDGIQSGCNLWGNHIKGMKRIFVFNESIVQLFTTAMKKTPMVMADYNLTEIHTNDSIKFFRPEQIQNLADRSKYLRRIDWEKDNLYCYDLTLPASIPDSAFYQYMTEDLKRMFNVSCRVEKRPRLCNVVTSFSGSKYALTNFHSTHDSTKLGFNKHQLILQHATVSDITTQILETFEDRDSPWVDESGINFPIDLTIELSNDINIDLIKKKLAEYGLKVEKKIVQYPILVLIDSKG